MKRTVVLVGVVLLAGCGPAAPVVTVTTTATVAAPVPVQTEPAPDLCAQMRAMRDTNQTLAAGGYADDYSATYDQLLEANGCPLTS